MSVVRPRLAVAAAAVRALALAVVVVATSPATAQAVPELVPVTTPGAGEPFTFHVPRGWIVMPLPPQDGGFASALAGRMSHGFVAMPPGALQRGTMAAVMGATVEGQRLEREDLEEIAMSTQGPVPAWTPTRIVSSTVERVHGVECVRIEVDSRTPMGPHVGVVWYMPGPDHVGMLMLFAPAGDAETLETFEALARATRGLAEPRPGVAGRLAAIVALALVAAAAWWVWKISTPRRRTG